MARTPLRQCASILTWLAPSIGAAPEPLALLPLLATEAASTPSLAGLVLKAFLESNPPPWAFVAQDEALNAGIELAERSESYRALGRNLADQLAQRGIFTIEPVARSLYASTET